MTHAKSNVNGNRLLAALPRKDRQHLLAGCEHVHLEVSDVLYEPDQKVHYVYFPLDCFASLIATINGQNRLEVCMIGNEGMLGTSLIIGVDVPLLSAMVQGTGTALRMKSAVFERELEYSPALKQILQRYFYVVMRQLAQTATCMRFHLVEERLARWLLMTRDRTCSDVLYLTQELLSNMLGVRRVSVCNAATSLQKRHLISYHRGEIMILDHAGLIAASCACYQADVDHYAKILLNPAVPTIVNPYGHMSANSPIESESEIMSAIS